MSQSSKSRKNPPVAPKPKSKPNVPPNKPVRKGAKTLANPAATYTHPPVPKKPDERFLHKTLATDTLERQLTIGQSDYVNVGPSKSILPCTKSEEQEAILPKSPTEASLPVYDNDLELPPPPKHSHCSTQVHYINQPPPSKIPDYVDIDDNEPTMDPMYVNQDSGLLPQTIDRISEEYYEEYTEEDNYLDPVSSQQPLGRILEEGETRDSALPGEEDDVLPDNEGCEISERLKRVPSFTSSGFASVKDDESQCMSDFGGWESDPDLLQDSDEAEDFDSLRLSKEEKCRRIAEEFMQTEQRYVHRLALLLRFSQELDLMAYNSASTLSEDVKLIPKEMVSRVRDLHNLHSKFFPRLQAVVQDWSKESCLIEALFQDGVFFTNHFSVYVPYIAKVGEFRRFIRILKTRSNHQVKLLLNDREQTPAFRRLGAEGMLMEPFQRLPKYKLLIERYHKNVDPALEEYVMFEELLSQLENCQQDIESRLKKQEATTTMQHIQKRIPGFMLIESYSKREFLMEDAVTVLHPLLDKQNHRHMFLFSDMLLLTTPQSSKHTKHTVQQHWPFYNIEVQSTEGFGADPDMCILLKQGDKYIFVKYRDTETKDRWEKAINDAVSERQEIYAARDEISVSYSSTTDCQDHLSSMLFTEAPVKKRYSSTKCCMRCSRDFSVIRRRYHCKGCGDLVCSTCSPYKVKMPYKKNTSQRVCHKCFLKAHDENPDLLYQ